MKALFIAGMVLASVIAVAGLMTANGITGNIIAGCSCISTACIQACGPNASVQCCTTNPGGLAQTSQFSSTGGYVISFIGLAGFFVLLGMNRKEQDTY